MKRDFRIIRQILLDIENDNLAEGELENREYTYHFDLVASEQCGFLLNEFLSLSPKGCEFLDKFRKEEKLNWCLSECDRLQIWGLEVLYMLSNKYDERLINES